MHFGFGLHKIFFAFNVCVYIYMYVCMYFNGFMTVCLGMGVKIDGDQKLM